MRSLQSRTCVAAVALTAATYAGAAGLGSTPAHAAAVCSTGEGVTVVVDFHDLGGGVQQVCDADGGGKYATTLFTGNGFDLTYVQKQPGFVCRIEAKPADDPCVNTPPADAYWGLWWSDGTKGTWTYSSLGAASLKVPDGGSVAFSWNRGAGQDKPGVNPPKHAQPTPTPTPSPSPSPTGGGNGNGNGNGDNQGGGSQSSASPSAAPQSSTPTSSLEPSASPTKKPKPEKPTESSSPEPTPTATEPTPEVDSQDLEATASPPAADEQGGLPTWLAPVVVVLLFGAAAGVAVVRRRGT